MFNLIGTYYVPNTINNYVYLKRISPTRKKKDTFHHKILSTFFVYTIMNKYDKKIQQISRVYYTLMSDFIIYNTIIAVICPSYCIIPIILIFAVGIPFTRFAFNSVMQQLEFYISSRFRITLLCYVVFAPFQPSCNKASLLSEHASYSLALFSAAFGDWGEGGGVWDLAWGGSPPLDPS